jgi:two-component system nitrate/nitrite response regulator NarL
MRLHLHKRVLVLDDHAAFTELLDLALIRGGHQVTAMPLPVTDGDIRALVTRVRTSKPTVVVLSLSLVTFYLGAKLVRPLAETGVPVVVFTDHDDAARYGQCLAAGARQVIGRDQRLSDLTGTLRRLGEGQPVLSVERRNELIEQWRQHQVRTDEVLERLDLLTPCEAEILTHLMHGRGAPEIARLRGVSLHTVRTQARRMMAKLDVTNQLAAVSLAYRVSWRTDLESVR